MPVSKLVAATLKTEEARKALGALLDVEEEKRESTWVTDVDLARKTLEQRQTEMLAVGALEPEPPEHRQDTVEGAELRSIIARANVGEMFDSVLNHSMPTGAMAELQQHYELNANQIPLSLLTRADGSEWETRAVTPAPTNVGQDQQPIIPYVFPQGVAAFLGIDMPTVGVGEKVFPC